MAKRTYHRGALVGVLALVVLVLVLLLIPVITADEPLPLPQVGNTVKDNAQICTMVGQFGGPIHLNEGDGTVEIFKIETPNADNQLDVVALLKCEATLTNDTGQAINYWGFGSGNCLIKLVESGYPVSFTESWSQTISASGNATLTCQFKRHH